MSDSIRLPISGTIRSTMWHFVLLCAPVVAAPPESPDRWFGQVALPPGDRRSSSAEAFAGEAQPEQDIANLSLEQLMNVQVVVTASRREQAIDTVPYAVSVITADDIRAMGARNIPDALRLAAGVDVADLSFGHAAVGPRGFHGLIASHVLVLVDGRQIFDSLFGGTLWGSWPFQLEDIERIEVIRGPGGVTWGANAVNGVINIITKDPADQQGLVLTTRGGSRGTIKQHVGYGLRDGDLRLRVSGEYESSDGFRQGGSFLRNLEDDYKGARLSLHAIYDPDDDTTYTLSAGSAVVDGGTSPMPLEVLGPRRNAGQQANFILFNLSRELSDSDRVDLTAFVNDFQASPGVPQIDYRYQQFGFQLARTYEPDASHTLTLGVDSRVDLLDAGNADPFMLTKDFVSTAILGVYVQDERRLSSAWTLNLGGRIDYESYSGFEPSARASLSRTLSDGGTIYGAVSRAFVLPTAAGRFLDIPLLGGLVRTTSPRDNDATTLIAYEVGWRGEPLDRVDAGINLFWHEFDDLTTISPEFGFPILAQNRFANRPGDASLYGAELEARFKVSERLTLLGNYTYQLLEWDVEKPFTDRDFITPPRHKAMLGARYRPREDLRLSAHAFFVDAVVAPDPSNPFVPQHIDEYVRLDLTAELALADRRTFLTLGVQNLLDRDHLEGATLFANDAEVPRMYFAEIRTEIP